MEREPLGILVVEDEQDIREMVALMVKGMGHTVYTAVNGREALEHIQQAPIDIVLLDLMMPEMDGFEFCQAVKADDTLLDLHIIITSAKEALEDKVKGLELGAADYVGKPFSLAEIRARIRVGERIVRRIKESRQQAGIAERNAKFNSEDSPSDLHQIFKAIEFPPEYYQSGVAILSYFGQVLLDKNPDTQAKLRIEQDGLTVRMIIETPEGEREQIEETLTQYGLVVTGKMPPERLLTNDLQVIQLQNKLEMAGLELSQNRKLLAYQEDRTRSLEEDKRNLFTLIEHGIGTQKDLKEIISQLLSKQSDVDAILQSLEEMAGRSADMQDTLERIVRELQRTNPDMLDKIHAKLLDYAASGTVGNAVYAGLLKLIEALPKI